MIVKQMAGPTDSTVTVSQLLITCQMGVFPSICYVRGLQPFLTITTKPRNIDAKRYIVQP